MGGNGVLYVDEVRRARVCRVQRVGKESAPNNIIITNIGPTVNIQVDAAYHVHERNNNSTVLNLLCVVLPL